MSDDHAASKTDENEANPAPQSPASQQSAPEQAAPEQAAPEQAAPEQAGPEQAAPEPSPPEQTAEQPSTTDPAATSPATGASEAAKPASKLARGSGPLAARGQGMAKPASPAVNKEVLAASTSTPPPGKAKKPKKKHPRPRVAGDKPEQPKPARSPEAAAKVMVPNQRQALSDDIQAELDAELAAADVDAMLSGPAGMPDRKEPLAEGATVQGQVLKIHNDSVYIALGGPDEGAVAFDQFSEEPAVGSTVEVIVRGINKEDGLYSLSLPRRRD